MTIFSLPRLTTVRSLRKLCSKSALTSFPVPAPKNHKMIGCWLLGTAGFTGGVMFIGSLTRRSEFKLTLSEWRSVRKLGIKSSEEDWLNEFAKYRRLDGLVSVDEFKQMVYLENIFKYYGYFTAAWFAVPAVYFWARGYLVTHTKRRVVALAGLFAAHVAVAPVFKKYFESDPDNEPRASPYKVTANTSLSLALYAIALWNGLSFVLPQIKIPDSTRYIVIRRLCAHPLMLTIFSTTIGGAIGASIGAGKIYNTYPKMADRWIPSDIIDPNLEPFWRNFYENPTMVQFYHRIEGEISYVAVLAMFVAARRIPGLHHRARYALNAMLAMGTVQVGLGITNLLLNAPLEFSAIHQVGSITLFSCAVWFANEIRKWKIPLKK